MQSGQYGPEALSGPSKNLPCSVCATCQYTPRVSATNQTCYTSHHCPKYIAMHPTPPDTHRHPTHSTPAAATPCRTVQRLVRVTHQRPPHRRHALQDSINHQQAPVHTKLKPARASHGIADSHDQPHCPSTASQHPSAILQHRTSTHEPLHHSACDASRTPSACLRLPSAAGSTTKQQPA